MRERDSTGSWARGQSVEGIRKERKTKKNKRKKKDFFVLLEDAPTVDEIHQKWEWRERNQSSRSTFGEDEKDLLFCLEWVVVAQLVGKQEERRSRGKDQKEQERHHAGHGPEKQWESQGFVQSFPKFHGVIVGVGSIHQELLHSSEFWGVQNQGFPFLFLCHLLSPFLLSLSLP